MKAFIEFIEQQDIAQNSFSALNGTLYNCMVAVRANNKVGFEQEYNEIKRREPVASAPYVYNDFFLFVLICGTVKFNLDQSWIKKILDSRNCSDDECELATLTLKNLLSSNFSSKNNHFPTVIVFQKLADFPLLDRTNLDVTYREIVQCSFPMFSSEFLNLMILRAYDIIVLQKDVLEQGETSRLKEFDKRFISRVQSISKALHWVLVLLLYTFVVYFYFTNQTFQSLIKPHLGLFNALGGGGLVAMYAFGSRISSYSEKKMKQYWGYTDKTNRT